jgi:hypothetical protein
MWSAVSSAWTPRTMVYSAISSGPMPARKHGKARLQIGQDSQFPLCPFCSAQIHETLACTPRKRRYCVGFPIGGD